MFIVFSYFVTAKITINVCSSMFLSKSLSKSDASDNLDGIFNQSFSKQNDRQTFVSSSHMAASFPIHRKASFHGRS